MAQPEEESAGRTLVVALGAMLGVALVVGLAVALVILGVVRFSGMGSGDAEPDGSRTLVLPSPSTTSSGTAGTSPAAPTTTNAPRPRPAIRLTMTPQQVGAGQRIQVAGAYRGGDGARLQVQRRDGGSWVDFPVTATVSDGRFATWIQTSRTGASPFRVYDAAAGKASNVVVVTVG